MSENFLNLNSMPDDADKDEQRPIYIIQRPDGLFETYDDTYDLTIHCTSQEEQDAVLARLNTEDTIEKIKTNIREMANYDNVDTLVDVMKIIKKHAGEKEGDLWVPQ